LFIPEQAAPVIKKPAVEYGFKQHINIAIHGCGMYRLYENLAQDFVYQCDPDQQKKRPAIHRYFKKAYGTDCGGKQNTKC
jgi:hypothetical protein